MVSKHVKQKCIEIQQEISKSKIITEDFNTLPLTVN